MTERVHDPAPAPAPAPPLRRLDKPATLSALARAGEAQAPTTSARDAKPAASQAPAEQAQAQAPAAGYRNHQAAERWMESAGKYCNLEPNDPEHRAVLIENLAAYGETILNRQIASHKVRQSDLAGKPGTKEHRNRWDRAFKWLDNQRGSVEPTPSDHLPRFKAFGPGDGPAYAVTEAQAAKAHAAGWRVIGPGYGSAESTEVGPLRVDEEGRRWERLPDGTEIQVYTLNELGVMNGKQISDHLETIMSSVPTPGEIPRKRSRSAGYIPPWLMSSASGVVSLVTALAAEITRDGSEWGRF